MLKAEDTDVLILSGGIGKRLRSVVSDRPKPMAEINDRPFIDILIGYMSGFGFHRFILLTGYMSEVIEKYFKDRKDIEIRISKEEEALGTGGAVKNAEELIRSNPFLVMNGDSFFNMDMREFLKFHEASKAAVSLALVVSENEADYGAVTVDKNLRVTGFAEKSVSNGLINGGIYLFDRTSLEAMPSGTFYSLEHDYFPSNLDRPVYGYITDGTLIDIGTAERYEAAKLGGLPLD